jgi:hypothetical protein
MIRPLRDKCNGNVPLGVENLHREAGGQSCSRLTTEWGR